MTIPKNVINPFSKKFEETWTLWKMWRQEFDNFKYKGVISEQMALKKLAELSEGIEEKAIAIVEQSIERQWTGFYKVKNSSKNGGTKKQSDSAQPEQSITDKFKNEFMRSNGIGKQEGNGDHLKAV